MVLFGFISPLCRGGSPDDIKKAETQRVNQLLRENKPEEALLEIDRLSEKYPNNPAYLASAGGLLIGMQRYDQAKEKLDMALKLDPDNALANRNMGILYYELDACKHAIPYLEKGLELGVFDPLEIVYATGVCYQRVGNLDYAVAYLAAYRLKVEESEENKEKIKNVDLILENYNKNENFDSEKVTQGILKNLREYEN